MGIQDTNVNYVDGQRDLNNELANNNTSTGAVDEMDITIPFDPRLARYDAFKTTDAIYPFADNTASSVYYDLVFSVEKSVRDEMMQQSGNSGTNGQNTLEENNVEAGDRVVTDTKQAEQFQKDADVWGT